MRERLNLRTFIGMVAPPLVYTIMQEVCGWGAMAAALIKGIRGGMDMFSMQEIDFAAYAIAALIAIPVFWIILDRDGMFYPSDYRYEKTKTWRLIYACGFGYCIAAAMNRVLALVRINQLFPGYAETSDVLFSVGFLMETAVVCFLVPVAEELIFRGIVYNRMKRCMSVAAAGFWTSLFFGIWHGNVAQGIYAFVLGLCLVYVKEKYQTIWAPILFHMFANLFAVILEEIVVVSEFLTNETLFPAFLVLELAVCIIFIWRIEEDVNPRRIKKNREWHREENEPVDRSRAEE